MSRESMSIQLTVTVSCQQPPWGTGSPGQPAARMHRPTIAGRGLAPVPADQLPGMGLPQPPSLYRNPLES